MKYKISNELLKLREYGRNVQMMVDYCRTLEDREERNILSREIVRIMTHMNPSLREGANPGEDHRQKMWDHFFHLAEFDIDIELDPAIVLPTPESMFTRPPVRMAYNNKRSRFRQYGRNIELMAEEALRIDDLEERHALVSLILNIMKMHIKGGEKDSNAEIIVCEHLKILTKRQLEYAPGEIRFHKFSSHAPPLQQTSQSSYRGHKKGHKGNKHHKKKRK